MRAEGLMMMITIMIVSSVARLDIEIQRAKHNQECPVSSHLIAEVSVLARPGLGDKVTLCSLVATKFLWKF